MSIEFISGKPGGGKTLMAVEFIVGEVIGTERTVVTNVPLDLGALNEYLQSRVTDRVINLADRIQILDDEGMKEFFRHRGRERTLGRVESEKDKDGKRKFLRANYADAGADWRPCFYVLDELHLFFNARAWMKTGEAALHYLSQHRKMGDDVLCVTQYTKNVDAQFRALAQEFHQVRNLSKEKWGIFAGPPRFKVISGQMDFSVTTQQEVNVSFFRFNPDLGKLYDTAAGVGLVGAMAADKGKKAKGIPIWWVLPPLIVGGIAVCTLPLWLPKLLVPKAEDIGKLAGNTVAPTATPTYAPAPASYPMGGYAPSAQPPAWGAPAAGPEVSGFVYSERGAVVYLKNGERRHVNPLTRDRDGIGRITFNVVEVDGEPVRVILPPRPRVPVAVAAVSPAVGVTP